MFSSIKDDLNTISNSDCEVIIHMYLKYGIEYTCKHLDGVFAFVLWDKSENALAFADETKVTFGSKTNGDLRISHTNDLASQVDSNGDTITDGDYASYINERGEGPLVFKTNGGPGAGAYQFFDTAWRPILKLFSGSSARAALYHAATERLVTTEQGIDVTGLNVSGVSTFLGEFHDKDGDAGGDGDFLTAT